MIIYGINPSLILLYIAPHNLHHVLDQIIIHPQRHHFTLQLCPLRYLPQCLLHHLLQFLILLYQ